MRKPGFWSILHRVMTLCTLFLQGMQSPAFAAELNLPLISAPRRAFPLMHESMAWSNSQYQGMHLFLQTRVPERFRIASIWGWDILSTYLPLGSSWLHEEWHRSILSQHGIDSFNEVYEFKFFASSLAVNRVQDASLAKLKAEHPADFVRMSSAGIEAQWEQNGRLATQDFFGSPSSSISGPNSKVIQWPIYWLNTANSLLYLGTCATGLSNTLTAEHESDEGTDVRVRDFTGLDCVAWTYDLWRPHEAYAARGTHPSGVGVRRYRKLSDLKNAERTYLQLHSTLSLLNLLDPALWRFGDLSEGELERPSSRTFARYHLAPFGTQASLHFQTHAGFFGVPQESSVQLALNHKRLWPGFHFYFPMLKLSALGLNDLWTVSARGWVMQQPRQLLFDDSEPMLSLGGSVRTHYNIYQASDLVLAPWLEFFAKSAGWFPGEDLLTHQWGIRTGVTLTL